MAKYKKITISVSNDEINALEDLIMLNLSEEKEEIARKKALKIWGRLVKEWDKKYKKSKKDFVDAMFKTSSNVIMKSLCSREDEIQNV